MIYLTAVREAHRAVLAAIEARVETNTVCEVVSLSVRCTAAFFITAYLGRKVYLLVHSTLQNKNLPPMLFKVIDIILQVVAHLFCVIVPAGTEASVGLGFAWSATKLFGDTNTIWHIGVAIGAVPAIIAALSTLSYMEHGRWLP